MDINVFAPNELPVALGVLRAIDLPLTAPQERFIVQFHLGVKQTPIAEASCKIDLSDHWDFWPYMARPLEEVRAELGIPALAA